MIANLYLILLLVFAGSISQTLGLLKGPCNSYEREKLNEGYLSCVYKDSKGIPTVRVGFNLRKSGAAYRITNVGADYNAILSGRECLRDNQIRELFETDMNTAVKCASS